MKPKTIVAALVFTVAAGAGWVEGEPADECRWECAIDFEACRNTCIENPDLDSCIDDCRRVSEDCLDGCG